MPYSHNPKLLFGVVGVVGVLRDHSPVCLFPSFLHSVSHLVTTLLPIFNSSFAINLLVISLGKAVLDCHCLLDALFLLGRSGRALLLAGAGVHEGAVLAGAVAFH